MNVCPPCSIWECQDHSQRQLKPLREVHRHPLQQAGRHRGRQDRAVPAGEVTCLSPGGPEPLGRAAAARDPQPHGGVGCTPSAWPWLSLCCSSLASVPEIPAGNPPTGTFSGKALVNIVLFTVCLSVWLRMASSRPPIPQHLVLPLLGPR